MITSLLLAAVFQQTGSSGPIAVLNVESGPVKLIAGSASPVNARSREVLRGPTTVKIGKAVATVTVYRSMEVWRLSPASVYTVRADGLVWVDGPKAKRIATHTRTRRSKPTRNISLGGSIRGDLGERGIDQVGAFRHGPIRVTGRGEEWASSINGEVFSELGELLYEVGPPPSHPIAFELPTRLTDNGQWVEVSVVFRGTAQRGGVRVVRRQTSLRVLTQTELVELGESEKSLKSALSSVPKSLAEALGDLYADFGLASEFAGVIKLGFGAERDTSMAWRRLGELYERSNIALEARQAFDRAAQLAKREQALAKR